MWSRAKLLLCLCPLLLSGCGFTPLYAKKSEAPDEHSKLLANIKINPIAGRMGQQLKIAIEDQLGPDGSMAVSPVYKLVANIGDSSSAIGVARDGTVSRYNVYLTSQYILYRTSDDQAVATGTVRNVSSYNNVTNAYFSTYVSEDDAVKHGLEEMGVEYRQRMVAYLTQPDAGTPLKVQPKSLKGRPYDLQQQQQYNIPQSLGNQGLTMPPIVTP